ncbi:hypothetical protein [Maribacter sp. 2307ULW6-5]|uniref:hypothetical protein n=1 Tax=Maribacter sp. 2307ULW6-5 TaxID=3386275 RepID=UPI0039BC43B3
MKKSILGLFLAVCLVGACEDRDDDLTTAALRIGNLGNVNFTTVQVGTKGPIFENVPAGAYSEYVEMPAVFREDTLFVQADSAQFFYEPTTVGDTLPLGLYTYELRVSPDGRLDFNFTVGD